jgi:hypothetical protein
VWLAAGAAARVAKARPRHGQTETVSAGQRAAVRARGAAWPGNAEYTDVVTAHTQGEPAKDMLRTDFKAPRKRFPQNLEL